MRYLQSCTEPRMAIDDLLTLILTMNLSFNDITYTIQYVPKNVGFSAL